MCHLASRIWQRHVPCAMCAYGMRPFVHVHARGMRRLPCPICLVAFGMRACAIWHLACVRVHAASAMRRLPDRIGMRPCAMYHDVVIWHVRTRHAGMSGMLVACGVCHLA
jgi:hypothetical protein